MSPGDKPLAWLHGDIQTPPFSAAARLEAGFLLRRIQRGHKLGLPHSRPMPSIGPRCHELRIKDETHTWRIIYRIDPELNPDPGCVRQGYRTDAQVCDRYVQRSTEGIRCARLRGIMTKARRKKLESAGWKLGSVKEFLGLNDEENAFVELKVVLSEKLRERRTKSGLSQSELAKRLGSSQSRVAKMEASDPTVSLDLLVKGLLATGATTQQIGNAIAKTPPKRLARTGS